MSLRLRYIQPLREHKHAYVNESSWNMFEPDRVCNNKTAKPEVDWTVSQKDEVFLVYPLHRIPSWQAYITWFIECPSDQSESINKKFLIDLIDIRSKMSDVCLPAGYAMQEGVSHVAT